MTDRLGTQTDGAAAGRVHCGEDLEALVESLESLLARRCDEDSLRALLDTSSGYDTDVWREFAEFGLTGLLIGEEDGGTGLGIIELERLAEALGAALAGGPFIASGVLAASLLMELGRREPLPALANGSSIATVAITGEQGGWTPETVAVVAHDGKLSGAAGFVLDGQNADLLIVVAREAQGISIFELPSATPGVEIRPLPTFDMTRRLAHIRFDGAAAKRIGEGWEPVSRALDVSRIALAGEAAGGARAMLTRTVEYARTRFQFGRAIGSFQAIKHMAADLLLESESAISAARHAAQTYASDDPDAAVALALASFACPDAFVRVAADAIQMHGGIGFTWEHPAHLYFRRARSCAQLFGSGASHREQLVRLLEN